ncbi:hypothetical protein ACU686_27115 [Yinghuangia aomiensis]
MNPRRTTASGGLGPGGGRFFGPGELRWALLALDRRTPRSRLRIDDPSGRPASRAPTRRARARSIRRCNSSRTKAWCAWNSTGTARSSTSPTRDATEVRDHAREIDKIWARAAARGEWGMLRDPDASEIVGPALRLFKAAVSTIVRAHGDPVTVVDRVRAILDDARHEIKQVKAETKRRGHHHHHRRRDRGHHDD